MWMELTASKIEDPDDFPEPYACANQLWINLDHIISIMQVDGNLLRLRNMVFTMSDSTQWRIENEAEMEALSQWLADNASK